MGNSWKRGMKFVMETKREDFQFDQGNAERSLQLEHLPCLGIRGVETVQENGPPIVWHL